MAVWHPCLHRDTQRFRFPHVSKRLALFTLLRRELLKHAWPNLAGHHLVAAVALPLPLGWLDHVLVARDLQRIQSLHVTQSALG